MQANNQELQQIINTVSEADLLRQIAIEDEARAAGKAAYYRAAEGKGTASSVPGSALIKQTVMPLAKALEKWVSEVKEAKNGVARNAAAVKFFEKLPFEDSAYVAIRVLLDMAGDSGKKTAILMTIARTIHDEVEFLKFREFNKSLFDWSMDYNKKYTSAHYSRYVGLLTKRRAGLADEVWTQDELGKVGNVMLELALAIHVNINGQPVPLFEEYVSRERQKTVSHIKISDAATAWINESNEYCALKTPLHMPMVVKPNPWTTMTDGGYYTFRTQLIKTGNRAYLEELNNNPEYTQGIRDAVNSLQETPWSINKFILRVFDELWTDNGGGMAGLPPADDYPLPAKPHDIATNPEALKAWKRKAGEVHELNAKLKSKRKATFTKLMLAKKFAPEMAIFFPHTADFRGRLYPMTSQLHPQGDDLSKALLTFAEGKALGENGVAWLKVHLANCFGVDKVSFQERIDWTEKHHEQILEAAMFPTTGTSWWMAADAPFQFLAACLDYMGYCIDGDEHVSHLPIGLDGACNGLQHLSALVLDEGGGKAVALVGGDKPSDVYSDVANHAIAIMRNDNCAEAKWLLEVGFNRKFTKSNTMTYSYSSTQQGRRDQMEDFLAKNFSGVDKAFRTAVANYAAKVNAEAITQVVQAAPSVMKWLQDAARVLAQSDMPIRWTTPMGLPIMQRYMASTAERLRLFFQGKETKVTLTVNDPKKLDRRKQAAGVSPNYIHSLDSAHLMMTVLKCKQKGINSFAAIHDSYGTHAADLTELSITLRETFIEIYSVDRLAKLRDEMLEQFPDAKLPELPAKGTLNLEEVLNSDYFFA